MDDQRYEEITRGIFGELKIDMDHVNDHELYNISHMLIRIQQAYTNIAGIDAIETIENILTGCANAFNNEITKRNEENE